MDDVYVHGARVPVTAEVLADAAQWRAVMDAAREQLLASMTQGNAEVVERTPGVWEPIGRLGRKG